MQLNFSSAIKLIKKHKIPYVESVLCKKEEDALKASEKIGFPLVMKISSSDIIHKSDIGAVRTDIKNKEELIKEFEALKKIAKRKKAKLEGILLQKQKTGKEIIIGVKKDAQFGNAIMFGLGGVFVEVYKDVSFRICPIKKEQAEEMIKEIKAYSILKGIRGEKSVNINALAELLVKTSKMAGKEKINELDFNPVIVNQNSAFVVDARIIK